VSSPDAPVITSKTLRDNLGPKGQWRVDIENPSSGTGAASMHFQMGGEGSPKWYYNWGTSEWVDEEGNVLGARIAARIPQSVVGRALQYFGLDANPLGSGIPPVEEEP
jgi:hypothetical protein